MFSWRLTQKKLVWVSVLIVSLLMVVGCSTDKNDINQGTGSLKVTVPVSEVSQSNSVQKMVFNASKKIEVTVVNQTDESDKYTANKEVTGEKVKFAFDELKVGSNYKILIKVKNNNGNVLYEVEKSAKVISKGSITEVDINLKDKKITPEVLDILAAASNQAVIYYKQGFDNPYIHYGVDGSWTEVPGKAMDDAVDYPGYSVYTIDLGSATQAEVCFNDGNGTWDNNGGDNYFFGTGVSTFEDGTITDGAPDINTATIYYKQGFDPAYIHYRPENGTWTEAPGKQMNDSQYAGYTVYTINLGDKTQAEVCFNDGNGNWDSNGGDNYFFGTGESTFEDGTITDGPPESETNTATIYYKQGFDPAYIHYRPENGTWTEAPGKQMDDSQYTGYTVYTIDLGNKTQAEVCFNDGNGNWDSNGGDNYFFGIGESTFEDGTISDGPPEEDGSDLPDIPSDKVNQTMYQAFYWNMDGGLWTDLQSEADDFAQIGITSIWLPPAAKAWGGMNNDADESVGYSVYDFWDLGEFDQKGSVSTKYGDKGDLGDAVSALHGAEIKVYFDAVFNHRMGADASETVDGHEVWTKFNFAGREKYYTSQNFPNLYHDYNWDKYCFDGTDYDDDDKGELFSFKEWDVNDDYLMGADVDYSHTYIVDEMKAWGKWIINDINFDGFRLDAVKHVQDSFVDNWISYVQNNTAKDIFVVGEAWIEDVGDLEDYLDAVGNSNLRVFDFPLRSKFDEANNGLSSGNKDLSKFGAWDGLVHVRPSQTVTFVDNHDTCRDGNPYDKPQIRNFKNQAYAYILMRENGVPCVYAKDYKDFNMEPTLDKLIKARRYFAYGPGHEVSNNSHDVYSYVREGLDSVAGDGLVMMISDGTSGDIATKHINSYQPNTTFYDFTGNVSGTVTTDGDGYGDFKVKKSEGSGWSIWVPKNN